MALTKLNNQNSQAPKYWWKKEFGKRYYSIYNPQLPYNRTKSEVEFIKKVVSLNHNQHILDLGCGQGRHTRELARQKFKVTGLDYSDYLLDIACKEAKKQDVQAKFLKQDMRFLNIHNTYDVIISMYSTFGYFTHKENFRVLQHVFSALKDDGKFLIDIINAENLASNAIQKGHKLSNGEYSTTLTYKLDSIYIKETNTYTKNTQLGHTHKVCNIDKQNFALDIYMIEYTLGQYKQMLESIGFQIENLYGDYDRRRWSIDSNRTIIFCRKPRNYRNGLNNLHRFINLKILRRWPNLTNTKLHKLIVL
jgi:cyclopropane fatty-acyl-phospholipid synthase-like methyltransferase